jgi:hypothetical protein
MWNNAASFHSLSTILNPLADKKSTDNKCLIPLADYSAIATVLISSLADNPLFSFENFNKEKLTLKFLLSLKPVNYLLLAVIIFEPKIFKNQKWKQENSQRSIADCKEP